MMAKKTKPSQQTESKKLHVDHIGRLYLEGKHIQTVDRDTCTSIAEFQSNHICYFWI